jgi:hypothetical protein
MWLVRSRSFADQEIKTASFELAACGGGDGILPICAAFQSGCKGAVGFLD